MEFMDSTKMFEHACRECTKNHWACKKCSQTVTRKGVNVHGGTCHTMKISADASCTKSKLDINVV